MRDEPEEFVIHLLDLLRRWAPVAARRMFGGYGLFRGGIMFGLVSDETLFFKTDAGNRDQYEAALRNRRPATRGRREAARDGNDVPRVESADDREGIG